MSIKLKLALYNTFLMSIVVILVLVFMNSISSTVVENTTKNQLKFIVHDNAEEIEWDDGKLELDDISFNENHVTTLIYSKDGYHIAGNISHIEEFNVPLTHGEITPITVAGINFIIYDYLVPSKKHEDIFIRGIVSLSEVTETVETLFYLTFCTLPLMIIFAGLGSYFISKKSMKPLEKIIDTANEISNGDDLSRRIDLGEGKDELHNLSETFDTMFGKLEKAFMAEKQFTSDVSHELRTPIAVILAECECSLNDTNDTSNTDTDAIKSIQSQAKKMQALTTALLNFIRMDNGIHKPNLEEVDLSELISLVCEEQESLLPENKKIITDLPETLLCNLDYGMMIRVLSNLIDNGFKYGKEDGFVKITLQEQEEFILLSIEDNGIGIKNEHIENIFNRFYQVDTSRNKTNQSSMGLGLSMVEQIIKCHNGTITVDSTHDIGTCFNITLPKF